MDRKQFRYSDVDTTNIVPIKRFLFNIANTMKYSCFHPFLPQPQFLTTFCNAFEILKPF